jgi:hypothetical protein
MTLGLTLLLGILFHFIGDYLLQNDYIANHKTKSKIVVTIHVLLYSWLFLFITTPLAVLGIAITHWFIDHYRLAKYWIMLVNIKVIKDSFDLILNNWSFDIGDVLDCGNGDSVRVIRKKGTTYKVVAHKPDECIEYLFGIFQYNNTPTGFPKDRPDWLSTWLLIIIDNIFHILINSLLIWLCY